MTPTFSRPNAAMFAYEQSLMRPRTWPPTRHDAPTLWQRAKAMFAVMLAAITSAADLARRLRFSRKERRELVARLAPVEKLVRMLMMTEAAIFLLMTPEGRRLREETPKIEPPAPPPPVTVAVGVARPKHETRILMPGWQTIAALQPYIDPRIVEREQREKREALARRIAGLEAATQELAQQDPHDPQHWRCRFPVLRWAHDRDDEVHSISRDAPRAASGPRPRCIAFDDTNFPIVPGMTVIDDKSRALDDAPFNRGRDLARRIEALSRILADPAAAIHRLARRLASLPADVLPEPDMRIVPTRAWHHGVPENWNACALAAPAFRALVQLAAHKHDPG